MKDIIRKIAVVVSIIPITLGLIYGSDYLIRTFGIIAAVTLPILVPVILCLCVAMLERLYYTNHLGH